MTVFQSMQQGIQAIQVGNHAEGERLLRYALKDPALKGRLRATALNWLGEVTADHDEKVRCFNQALEADPSNEFAEERLANLLSPTRPSAPPPPDTLPGDTTAQVVPPPTLPGESSALIPPPPPAPVYAPPGTTRSTGPDLLTVPVQSVPGTAYDVVGVVDGPNGPGSAFFLSTSGVLATTRYVVGARETVTVELAPGSRHVAQVIRSFPHLDVALLKTDQTVPRLLPFSAQDDLREGASIVVMPYHCDRIYGRRRETGRSMAPHLFPTDITQVADAGGGPVLNEQQVVVGMITRDISSSSAYVYGVHIAAVRRCLEIYDREIGSVQNRVYCASCGYASAVAGIGGYYCESCGTVLPQARDVPRAQTPNMAALYGENAYAPCTHCGARVGFYDGLCLRCGYAGDPSRATG